MSMSIEEIDIKLRFGNPSSKVPAHISWFLTLVYWGVGTYWIIKNLIEASPFIIAVLAVFSSIVAPVIVKNAPLITTYITLLISIVFIMSFLLLLLIRNIARIILMIVLVLSLIFDISVGSILLVTGNVIFGGISLAFALILGFILVRYWERIKFVGRLMELSSSVVLREKGTILSTVLSMIISSYTLLTMSFTNILISDLIISFTGSTEYAFYLSLIHI